MDDSQYQSFMYEIRRVNIKLEKVIELLELRNSIEVARDEMRAGAKSLDNGTQCICAQSKTGSTGGWICPVHGQCH